MTLRLILAFVATTITIAVVHYQQTAEKTVLITVYPERTQRMHNGVIKDKVRMEEKRKQGLTIKETSRIENLS